MSTIAELSAEQRFELLMEAASDYAIFLTDIQGDICEWSRSAETIIGYTEAEALRMNCRLIFTPEDRGRKAPELEMETAAREGQASDERWHLRKDGTMFFAVGRLVALRGRDGKLAGFAKIVRDATRYKALEQALKASDEQFRATFAQAPIAMALSDLKGRIQQVNMALVELVGFQDRELEGRALIDLTAPEDRPETEQRTQELFAGERDAITFEKRLVRRDGSLVWVRNSTAILRDAESRPLCLIDLMHDISVLKLSEAELSGIVDQRTFALREKTKQMEAFCYTVAHDLRAPLRAISGYAEIIDQDFAAKLPEDALELIRRIEASANRLDRLISDLLGYTRMQQVPLVRERVDLTAVADRVVEQVKRDHPNEPMTVMIHEPLGVVRADGVTLEHVFLNLVSNAVKFRRPGIPPEIHIRAEDRGERHRVWVEDNGIGIDPRFTDRVFGMFERLHPERSIPGTGVGLAIVATAMERLGGTRGFEPNATGGSRFWIELPK